MIYNPAQPIDLIFNSINELVEYTREVKSELTQSQTMNLDLVIFKRKTNFQRRHLGVEMHQDGVQNMR